MPFELNSFEQPDNVFLKMPHFFKPLQALNAVILAICVGSTAGADNGILWFVIITSLLISAAVTVVFAMGIQDQLMESITNGSVQWNFVELIYSFIFAVLSLISMWVSFSQANRSLYSTSAGYIASGLFFILHTALYSVPCFVIYRESSTAAQRDDRVDFGVEPAHPFRDSPYQGV
ncbi:hypothetical protein WR25_06186 [Diploscapter pachys]|uniref:MARVEL domain-containing protein n=1 Tax=Diploscapter pachys TaxID=2018661 RepID=A0A2A2LSQ8_9BILA|nr:hypothetical protein WR25_06186 [Diploscapter pachys]